MSKQKIYFASAMAFVVVATTLYFFNKKSSNQSSGFEGAKIGNHTFYENIEKHNFFTATANPYFEVMLDENFKWLHSHKIGIEGPIMPFSTRLNIWPFSFERKAHYVALSN